MIGKALLPKTLLGRTLLILVLPTVLIQLVMAYVFFDRHWESVTRYLSNALAGEIILLSNHLRQEQDPKRRESVLSEFMTVTGTNGFFDVPEAFTRDQATREFPEFRERLAHDLGVPFTVRRTDSGTIEISILLDDQTLRLQTTVKRLESRTTSLFLFWMLGTSTLFLLIGIIFLRNQMRPIRKLAEAADSFGRGIDMPDFRPSGAAEVRKASRAFIIMRERIKRQMRTRTDMLSSISHDLRTPLTRMKLQLAMLEGKEAVRELTGDVQQMEHMIAEYLDFARGEGREDTSAVSLREFLEDVVNDYARAGGNVSLVEGADVVADIRVSGFRRMLHNIIDNALRYGKRCDIALKRSSGACEIVLDDDGPGIAIEAREEVFKPFSRLDLARNVKTGGVGLGLTIARDIIMAHGGQISLDAAPTGGLRVIIRLPLLKE